MHVGAATCGQGSCHGSKEPSPFAMVELNEFHVWSQQDKHAQAFKVLSGAQASGITRALGLGRAEGEPLCLACHANNVPPSRRGRKFSLSDGVFCEACHGGADPWLGTHSDGKRTHADNLRAGMYPTDDPEARAQLCFSCHIGTAANPMSHRLLGAGHPRLTIELDTFTVARPAHHVEDDDYRKRKPDSNAVRTWAVGQALAATRWLEIARVTAGRASGLFPELSLFECYGCHVSIGDGSATGGHPRLDLSALRMLVVISTRIDAKRARSIDAELHAISRDAALKNLETRLAALYAEATDIAREVATKNLGTDDARAWLEQLLSSAEKHEYDSHALAEQATYSVGTLVAVLQEAGKAPSGGKVESALDALYDEADKARRFDASRWRAAAGQLARSLAINQ